jgi:transcriptional regulator with XRE-family HTH domain
MEMLNSQNRNSGSIFGRLLAQKRSKAGLSLAEMSELTRLSQGLLEELESGVAAPNFDTCYKIAQAINSRDRQGFVIQDLWEAASIDRHSRMSRAADHKSRLTGLPHMRPLALRREPQAA